MPERPDPTARPGQRIRSWLRGLMRAYPADFRRTVGADLEQVIVDRIRDARARWGVGGCVGMLAFESFSLVRHGIAERWATRPPLPGDGPSIHRPSRTLGLLMKITTSIRHALRSLFRNPGFGLAAIGILALGIGANSAGFTLMYQVAMRPLPYPDAHEVVRVYSAHPSRDAFRSSHSIPDLEDWSRDNETLDALGGYSTLPGGMVLTGRGEAAELPSAFVTAGFFETLGVPAHVGRTLLPEEEIGDNRVVVLSYGSWVTRFGSDLSIVGSTITLNDEPYRVTGVMPPEFSFPSPRTEAWVFLSIIEPDAIPMHLRFVRFANAIGRLAPGATPEQAEADLTRIASALSEEYPDSNVSLTAATVRPLQDELVGDSRTSLYIVLGAVGFLLILTCANVANLFLARNLKRETEFAVRASLGADRRRIVTELTMESLILGSVAGAVGLGLTWLMLTLFTSRLSPFLPRTEELGVDWVVGLFTLGVALIASLLVGLIPPLKLSRLSLSGVLRGGGSGGRGSLRGGWTRGGLVLTEVAVAVVLLVGSSLLLRSLWSLYQVDPGFNPDGVLAVNLTINSARYPERPDYLGFYERVRDELGSIPGVTGVGGMRRLPLRGVTEQVYWANPELPPAPAGQEPDANYQPVSADVFDVLGIPILQGREFTDDDRAFDRFMVVINQALAEEAFPTGDPVGRTLILGGDSVDVIGVAANVKHGRLEDPPEPIVYTFIHQIPRIEVTYAIRTEGDPLALVPAVRATLTSIDADQPIAEIFTAHGAIDESIAQPKVLAMILIVFGLIGTVLSSAGIFGVIAYQVRRRTHEIGVRRVVGAESDEVTRMIVRDGMVPPILGVVLGVGVSWAFARLISSRLYDVPPTDPLSYGAVIVVVTLVALLACYLPARQAAHIDPVKSLRSH